ncbi:unnamed protein product [Callosobruchus maculatus]|uniref:Uncharacterized protein n=1 Tax=Callosobruchus maculatus TaxID=64391 RepID=A0A653CKP9_CALMS|nr:unnamed protein product [Callosobruchus maculatus]
MARRIYAGTNYLNSTKPKYVVIAHKLMREVTLGEKKSRCYCHIYLSLFICQ